VAGLPGERIRIEPPWLVVDDERVTDPPIFATIAAKEQGYTGFLSAVHTGGDANSPSDEVTLGEDEYFLLGDKAGSAYDSRYWGPISRKKIVGLVTQQNP
jgi:signal peptidase I